MSSSQALEKMVRELPPPEQAEVRDFVEFLMQKRKTSRIRKLKQNWAGGLKQFKKKYSSLELQKKSMEWRDN